MKQLILTCTTIAAFGLLAGCSGGADDGAPVPESKPLTAEQIEAMPPQAQQAAANAQKSGDFQSQRMSQMAEAQRQAGGR